MKLVQNHPTLPKLVLKAVYSAAWTNIPHAPGAELDLNAISHWLWPDGPPSSGKDSEKQLPNSSAQESSSGSLVESNTAVTEVVSASTHTTSASTVTSPESNSSPKPARNLKNMFSDSEDESHDEEEDEMEEMRRAVRLKRQGSKRESKEVEL